MVERGSAHSFLPAFASLTIPDSEGFVLRDMQNPYELEIGFLSTEEGFASDVLHELIAILDGFYKQHLDLSLYTLYN